MNWLDANLPKPFGTSHRNVHTLTARPLTPLLGLLMGLAATGGLPEAVVAAEWTITPTVSAKQAFTDNAAGTTRGQEKSDTYTTVAPGIWISGVGDRLKLDLDYTYSRSFYFDNTDLDNERHSLLSGGTATLIPELLFFDARGAIFQQTINPAGAQSASVDNPTPSSNSQSVKTYSLSPYLQNHFGSFADSELRYQFSQTLQGSGAGTSTTHRLSETLNSGDDFSTFRWTSLLDASETKGDGSSSVPTATSPFGGPAGDSSRRLAMFSPEYALSRYLILLSGVGYEKIDDPTLENSPDGIIGNAGVRVNPGPRSTFRVLWNHRYESNYITGDATYLIGPTSRLEFAHTRDIQTSSSMYSDSLSYLGTDDYGNFIDTRSQSTFKLDNQAFGLSNAAFRQQRTSLKFSTEQQRNGYTAEIFREKRESQNALTNQTSEGVNLSWGHAISDLMGFNLYIKYAENDYSDLVVGNEARQDQIIRVGPGLSYIFNDTLTGTMNYDFLYRVSNAAGGDMRENIVTIGVRKTF